VPSRSLLLAILPLLLAEAATADDSRRQTPLSGEQVYAEVCAACHATRVDKAPQYGDRKAWAPLIREGQAVLTAHAWVGIRGMPARGGRDDLSLEEFARGAAHMARAAGAPWPDPDASHLGRIQREVDKRLARSKPGK
jgi:cytochrome c5